MHNFTDNLIFKIDMSKKDLKYGYIPVSYEINLRYYGNSNFTETITIEI